ncbi:hypothetical protein M758_11G083200 [Ceratodon purpureus]|nr:hypothetical protein M758_11G083200 [Ceratodon purpureus]
MRSNMDRHNHMSQASEDFGSRSNYPSAPPPPTCDCPCHTCTCTCYRPPMTPTMTPLHPSLYPQRTPMHPSLHSAQAGRWKTGLCDMASDLNTCVWTCFCPCVTFGNNVAALDRGETTSCMQAASIWFGFLLIGLPCFCSAQWRKKLRQEFAIPAGECGDYCLHFWCGPCALCQEYRELKHRGLVMATASSADTIAPQNLHMNRN